MAYNVWAKKNNMSTRIESLDKTVDVVDVQHLEKLKEEFKTPYYEFLIYDSVLDENGNLHVKGKYIYNCVHSRLIYISYEK